MPKRITYSLVVGLLVGLIVACGGNPPAPIEDRRARQGESYSTRYYTVQRGDTMYSIAFRYGLDYRVVAAANGIAPPYLIYPGQQIDLQKTRPATTATRPAASGTQAAASPATKPPVKPATSATTGQPVSPTTTPASKPPDKTQVVTTTPTPTPTPTVSQPSTSSSSSGTWKGAPVRTWRWPSVGPVTRGYSATVHKGIDIGGKRGDAVVAAAAGQVVYAGTGIVGLGELLIIKHNEVYLSAYAHNDGLLVGEGQVVSAGQRIASKGSSGTDTVKLHFEIRREGKPIDPKKLLPKR